MEVNELNIQIKSITKGDTPNKLKIEIVVGQWNRHRTYKIIYSGTDIEGDHYFSEEQLDKLKNILRDFYGWAPFDMNRVTEVFEKNKFGEIHPIQIIT